MAKAREDVALGKIPTYPPLMVRALEKLNANPRYQNNPLKMSEFFQRQQDAINKVTGKNFQLLPATPEQNWMLSLPAPLYQKVTSGNLFQFKHVEAVVRGTVSQSLRSSFSPSGGAVLTRNEVTQLAISEGFTPEEAVFVQAIAKGESAWDTSNSTRRSGLYAQTGEDSVGLMQINWGYHKDRGWLQKLGITKREDLLDPVLNMRAAKYLYDQAKNFNDWTVFTSGEYKNNL
jgi:hypothetical protein